MNYFAYILRNADARSYIGISADPVNRLAQHNSGESKWTAKYQPWTLEWTSRPMSLGDARRLEIKLKKQKGGVGEETLKRDFGS